MGLKSILDKLNPVTRLEDHIERQIEEKTTIGMKAVLAAIDSALPEIGDLLSGEEIVVEIKVRLKQRQE